MKKILSVALVFALLLCISGTALGASEDGSTISIDDIQVNISDKLKDAVEDLDTDELSQMIKEKLDYAKGLSDEELYEYVSEFCEDYDVELTDEQMVKVSQYIKNASDTDLQDITEKIEGVKKTVGVLEKIFSALKSVAITIKDIAVVLYNGAKTLIDSIIN